MATRVGTEVPSQAYSTPELKLYFLRSWIAHELRANAHLDLAHESLLVRAREATNAWLAATPSTSVADRRAWLSAEGWTQARGSGQKSLYARLSLAFCLFDDKLRNGLILSGGGGGSGDQVLGVVREAGTEDDFVLYDPRSASVSRYAALDVLCEDALIKELGRDADIYYKLDTAPAAPEPAPEPAPPARVPELAPPSAPVRAKKPPAKKRAAGAPPATPHSSPLKKAVGSGGGAESVEESSGETAKINQ